MTRYLVAPRKTRHTRGVYAIFPTETCWSEEPGKLKLETELGRVRARTFSEAVRVAREHGIGEGLEIWAIEVLDDNRVTVIEE